jgi:predicted O-methyltransferase YrrM
MISILKKLLPARLKHAIAPSLRRALCPPAEKARVFAAGKAGETPNVWWDELEGLKNKTIFPELSATAKNACADIRAAYRPLLEHYGVNADDFFWGSIKNEEAEALYQLVLDRKPQIAYQIGTFVGYSALVIAHALRTNGSGLLIAVDPEIPHRTFINPVNVAREAAKAQGLAPFIRFERGWHSGALGDYLGLGLKRRIPIVGLQVMETVREQGIDLAFIDGDHSTACTLTDFLLLKDYLNVGGIAIFHDVLSWPTVAQGIFLLWHDIHYFVRGTSAYFALDVRRGQDGLAVLERIADENFPTLCLKLQNNNGDAIANAKVELPCVNLTAISDTDGTIYALAEIPAGVEVIITHPDYPPYRAPLSQGTQGDFTELTLNLEHGHENLEVAKKKLN